MFLKLALEAFIWFFPDFVPVPEALELRSVSSSERFASINDLYRPFCSFLREIGTMISCC